MWFKCSRFDSFLILIWTQNTTWLTIHKICNRTKQEHMKLTIPFYLHKAGLIDAAPITKSPMNTSNPNQAS